MEADWVTRYERHFGDRVVRCFASRPNDCFAAFAASAERDPGHEALVAGETRLTYAELSGLVGRAADALRNLGIAAGDRVVLFSANRADFVISLYAAFRLGAIAVPADARLTAPEVAHVARDSGARLILHDAPRTGQVPSPEELPPDCRAVAIDGLDSAVVEQPPPYVPSEEDPALIVYTSGTTGKPKGAILSHFGIVHSALHFQLNEEMSADDRIAVVTPVTHVTGLIMGVISAIQFGATVLLAERFKARDFLEFAAHERMTQTVMVPAMYALCLLEDDLSAFDLSAWRLGNYGGAPMPVATIEAVAERLPALQLVNGYGATETASPAIMLRPGEGLRHAQSVGRPLPCADICIMDEAGCEVPDGTAGEIWIAGPMVAEGYWNDPAATAAGFVGGYWRSGDVGMRDAAGYVHILDRIKDVVNRGGYKIYSAEVENVLAELADVLEVAVVGRPCPVLGERVQAFIGLRPGAQLCEDDLHSHAAARLADYKRPEAYVLSETPLPRSSNGKVLKRDLRALASAADAPPLRRTA